MTLADRIARLEEIAASVVTCESRPGAIQEIAEHLLFVLREQAKNQPGESSKP